MHPYVPALVVLVAMRVWFVFSPISADEGGYLAIARAWRRGAVLYRDVWVDRPQGLLVAYRVLDTVGLGTPMGVRLLGSVAAAVAVVACGDIAGRLVGPHAVGGTAVLVAVLVSLPQIEGFTANAELLSGAAGAGSLALALRATWHRDRPDLLGLVAAGMAGGVALSFKQSGFDGVVTATLVVGAHTVGRRWPRGDRYRAVPALMLGVAVPVAAMAAHGALTGWHRWWFAVAGYRAASRSVLEGANWPRLGETAQVVAPGFVPILVVVVVAAAATIRRARLASLGVLLTWTVTAVGAFVTGGQFFRHYWTILALPLGTFAGVVVANVRRPAVRASVVTALLVGPAVLTVSALALERSEIGPGLHDDGRLVKNERIADWFTEHSAPGDEIYAMCASAGLYGNLDVDPPLAYLWFDSVRHVPEARAMLVDLLDGPRAPRYVAGFQDADTCDPSGATGSALRRHYRPVALVAGTIIYEHVAGPAPGWRS